MPDKRQSFMDKLTCVSNPIRSSSALMVGSIITSLLRFCITVCLLSNIFLTSIALKHSLDFSTHSRYTSVSGRVATNNFLIRPSNSRTHTPKSEPL